MNNIYDVHGLGLCIKGSGPLFDYLRFQYSYFESDNKPKIGLTVSECLSNGAKIGESEGFKDGDCEYRKCNGRFIYSFEKSSVYFDGFKSLLMQEEICFQGKFNKSRASMLCDLMFRVSLAKSSKALVHCAAVEKGGDVTLISAFKGMGKTALALKLVESGFNFMSDDRVWIDSDSSIYTYPRYVVLKYNNIRYFDKFLTSSKYYRNAFYCKFISLIRKVPSNFLNKVFIKIFRYPSTHYHIDSLYPNAKVTYSGRLKSVLNLSKRAVITEGYIKKQSIGNSAEAIINISNFEWNAEIFRMAAVHDALFPDGPSWCSELYYLFNQERKIITQALQSSSEYLLYTPELDVDYKDIISQVESL